MEGDEAEGDEMTVLVDPFCERNDEFVEKLNRDFPGAGNFRLRLVYLEALPRTHAQNVAEARRDEDGDLNDQDIERIRAEARRKLDAFASLLECPKKEVQVVSGYPSPKEALVAVVKTMRAGTKIVIGPRRAAPTDVLGMAQTHLGPLSDFAGHCTDMISYS